jgi:F-type H+-transporting ATPase subunit epsilon
MTLLQLRIITPKAVVLEEEIESITAPGADGEVTVLARHVPLFLLLKEGVVTIRKDGDENFFSIGGGYLETNGKQVNLLVSRAFGQDQIDQKEVEAARAKAEQDLKDAPTEEARHNAMLSLRRSMIDLKVLGKIKRRKTSSV